MSLFVRNLQKSVQLSLPQLKSDVKTLQRILRIERYDIAIICVENGKIKELNKLYRGKDEVTDMLAFAAHETKEPGRLPDPWSDIADLGDIFLGVPYINEQCLEKGRKIETMLPVIIIHGLCHLIGYSHKDQHQRKQMREKESFILNEFNKITGGGVNPLS